VSIQSQNLDLIFVGQLTELEMRVNYAKIAYKWKQDPWAHELLPDFLT